MPRGNLETIYPRALVVAGIRQNLKDKKYKAAFLACRNHRVDMNILHDHSPQAFVADVSHFVDQVKKVEHIDLFLSQIRYERSNLRRHWLTDLREEDVCQSMYRETLNPKKRWSNTVDEGNRPVTSRDTSPSKVNRICDAFLSVLKSRASTNLQNIITAHVCKSPPDLDAGLIVVAKLAGKNNQCQFCMRN